MKKISILGFFFISIIGTLSHFVYEWSGNSDIIGAFFAVNESTWEHLKIAIIPAFVWMIISYFIVKDKNNFFTASLLSFLTIMISIVVMFYTYTAVLQKDVLVLDIIIFYLSIALGQYVSFKIMNYPKLPDTTEKTSLVLSIILLLSFIVFTYFPPKLEIFKDSTNNSYGIEKVS